MPVIPGGGVGVYKAALCLNPHREGQAGEVFSHVDQHCHASIRTGGVYYAMARYAEGG